MYHVEAVYEWDSGDKVTMSIDTDDDERPETVAIVRVNVMEMFAEGINKLLGTTLEATESTLEDEQP
jgi:hypothetical protein